MTDRDDVINKIIKGLEICYCPPAKCKDCPYHDLLDEQNCNDVLCLDALALLKEQKAHVLTLDEAVNGNGCYYVEFHYHPDMGWVKCDFSRMNLNGEVAMLFTRDKNFYQQEEHYGQLWRLWNKRPTYDQRQAVKWND